MNSVTRSSILWLILLSGSNCSIAQDTKDEKNVDRWQESKDSMNTDRWRKAMIHIAEDYKITLTGSAQPLAFRKEPVMNWVNPIRQSQFGVIHVWTEKGRPKVIGSIFVVNNAPRMTRVVIHEFHSLATTGLKADFDSKTVWKPTQGGIEYKLVPSAPVPADTPAKRLVQVKQLVRDFSGHSINQNSVNLRRQDLRLLPQPIYRYEVEDIHDGAIFGLVADDGTDIEIVLLFEVLDTPDGPRWHYAAARFSDKCIYLELKGVEVWKCVIPPGIQEYKCTEDDYVRVFQGKFIDPIDVDKFLAPTDKVVEEK